MTVEAERLGSARDTWDRHIDRLEQLAGRLAAAGLRTHLMLPAGRLPSLHVVNPAAVALAEDIYAGQGRDGTWWYWWPWAERIATGSDLGAATTIICRVLAAQQ